MRRSFLLPSLAIGLAYLAAFAIPPLIHTIAAERGTTVGAVGSLMTAYAVAYCLGGVAAGRLVDRIGAPRVIAGGVVVAGAATAACATTTSLALLDALRFLVGLGAAAILTAGVIHVVESAPAASHGAGIGAITVSAYLGAAAANGLTPLLVGSLGWQGVLAAAGIAVTAGGLVLSVGARRHETHVRPAPVPLAEVLGVVLRSRAVVAIALLSFLDLVALYGAHSWIPAYLEDRGVSDVARSAAGSFAGLGAIPGALIAGFAYARFRRPALLCAVSLAFCVPLVAVGVVDPTTATGYAVVVGAWALAAAGANAATVPLFSLGPVVVDRRAGNVAAGFVTTVGLAGPAVAADLGGRLLDAGAGFGSVFAVYGLAGLAGAVGSIAIRGVQRRAG